MIKIGLVYQYEVCAHRDGGWGYEITHQSTRGFDLKISSKLGFEAREEAEKEAIFHIKQLTQGESFDA